MFTGLVKELGIVKNISPNKEGKLITIKSSQVIGNINIDDSVSVNGACQTVIAFKSNEFTVQAVGTTLSKTTLGNLKIGEEVNLELALRMSDRLGGHLVQGHVNGQANVYKVKNTGDNYVMSLILNDSLMKYVVKEGSITINGVSLTVSDVEKGNIISVSIIPHTWFHTTFKNLLIGDKLNIEVDIIAKYVENLFNYRDKESKPVKTSLLSESWLRDQGF
jgi:riboflavin synthase